MEGGQNQQSVPEDLRRDFDRPQQLEQQPAREDGERSLPQHDDAPHESGVIPKSALVYEAVAQALYDHVATTLYLGDGLMAIMYNDMKGRPLTVRRVTEEDIKAAMLADLESFPAMTLYCESEAANKYARSTRELSKSKTKRDIYKSACAKALACPLREMQVLSGPMQKKVLELLSDALKPGTQDFDVRKFPLQLELGGHKYEVIKNSDFNAVPAYPDGRDCYVLDDPSLKDIPLDLRTSALTRVHVKTVFDHIESREGREAYVKGPLRYMYAYVQSHLRRTIGQSVLYDLKRGARDADIILTKDGKVSTHARQ
jgi:hypothetical protein